MAVDTDKNGNAGDNQNTDWELDIENIIDIGDNYTVSDDTGIGTIAGLNALETAVAESIIAQNTVEDTIPDIIITPEDALRAVDNSGLSPAPISIRPVINPVPYREAAAAGQKVDKYGLPVTQNDELDIIPSVSSVVSGALAETNTPSKPAIILPRQGLPKGNTGLSVRQTQELSNIDEDDEEPEEPDIPVVSSRKKQKDFKIKFDFESAYKDPPNNRPLRRRRERRTGLIGGLMFSVFILCTGLVLASVMWMFTTDVLGFAAPDEDVDINVPEGFVMEDITELLFDAGLIRYKSLFNIFAEYSEAESKISPGSYVLNKNYDYRALVQGMTARAGIRVETRVVIPEGFTLAQIFMLLENEEVCSAEELWDTATNYDFNFSFLSKETLGERLRLEGYLFPDTYNFYKNSTPVQAIIKMLRQFNNKYTEMYIERADYLGYTVHEIVTIASMIEREAGSDEERSRISAVIHNRLNNPNAFPMLEIDATIHYIIAGTGIPFSTNIDNIYNTYMYPGLPPGPIANPGIASIRAALYPLVDTGEYFYALNKSGTHNFFKNANDHNNFVNSDEYGG